MGFLTTIDHSRFCGALLALLLAAPAVRAQDTTRTTPPAAPAVSRIAARLLVVFRPPARGVRRERALTRGGDGARALIPSPAIDSLIPQTLRSEPFVAVCAAGEPDSARLIVRVGEVRSAVMIGLRAGLNRIALGDTHMTLADGDVAEWSLSTRTGEVFLVEFIQRLVVPSTPTITALAKNGIWHDALDLFVVDAIHGIPLAAERLETFLTSAGASGCTVTPTPP